MLRVEYINAASKVRLYTTHLSGAIHSGTSRVCHCSVTMLVSIQVGTETCEVDNVFPPEELWFGSNTYMNCVNCAVYIICIQMSKWCAMGFVYKCLTDGGRDGLRRSALSANWLSCIGCLLYLLSMKWLMCGTLFLHISTLLGCPRTVFSKKKPDWTSCLEPPLHEIYILY